MQESVRRQISIKRATSDEEQVYTESAGPVGLVMQHTGADNLQVVLG